jgi:hypothetical protein
MRPLGTRTDGRLRAFQCWSASGGFVAGGMERVPIAAVFRNVRSVGAYSDPVPVRAVKSDCASVAMRLCLCRLSCVLSLVGVPL